MANIMQAPLIKYGNRGDWVNTLQYMLNQVGNYGLIIDGIFGTKTLAAVRDFQQRRGLVVDGVVGDNTWNKLYDDVSKGYRYEAPKVAIQPTTVVPIATPTVVSPELPAFLGGINWTTIGIIAAVAVGLILLFTQKPEPTRAKTRRRRR